jgi:hypothetical protein
MPHARRPYPSDLTDQGWNLLKPPPASPQKRGRPPKRPLHAASPMPCSIYRALDAPGGCCLGGTLQ